MHGYVTMQEQRPRKTANSPVWDSTVACDCRVSCWLAYSELPPALLSSAFALVRYEDMACSSLLI